MNKRRTGARLAAALVGLSLVAAACGGDDDGETEDTGTEVTTDGTAGSDTTTAETAGSDTTTGDTAGSDTTTGDTGGTDTTSGGSEPPVEGIAGGEVIDVGTFVGDPPEHIDPHLNVALDSYQVVNAMYDGLTDIDASDPEDVKIVPHVADTVEASDDATVWTFHIREGAQFSTGEEINATTFQRSWERAAELGGDYSYLMNFIEGGEEKLADPSLTLTGVEADDASRTLTVTLAAPYAAFDAVAGFQLFFPMPEEAVDNDGYENEMMIGNGPYQLEAARTDEEIVLVKNENWQGDFEGNTWDDRLEKITFLAGDDPDTGYNALEAGEADIANIPPARAADASNDFGTTTDVRVAGSYYFRFNDRNEIVGGPDNVLLRQAISQAIDRDAINEAVFNGLRIPTTGIVPPGIPGHVADICDYCSFDQQAAQDAFDEWTAAGGSLSEPIPIQFNADAGHEPVVDLIIENLNQVGIEAVADPRPTETYFTEMADGECVFCRSGWYADYPAYDNFMYDLFHSDALGGNNYGFENAEFDELVDQGKESTDPAEAGELFNQAEEILLNEEVNAVPLNWYVGDYVFDDEKIANFPQNAFGLILWEQVALAG